MVKLQRIGLFITCLGLVSCMPLGRISKKGKDTGDYCAPALRYVYDSTYVPLGDVQAILKTDTSFFRKYSRHDLLMANATGILPLLKELSQLEGKQDDDSQLERVRKRQQIQSRLLLASTEIASFAAELDCEGERAEQLATYLDQKDNKRIRKLTIFSVVIGAVTTVATALIQADNTSKVVGVAGGLVSAATGGLAAFSSNQTIPYMHKRNLLADLWTQPKESTIYPPFIWYVLNEKSFSNSGQTSIAYNIRQRWKDYMLEDSSQEEKVLYFSEGGNYQADDLHVRANMINQLQSSIRSINQDLQSLTLSLGDK